MLCIEQCAGSSNQCVPPKRSTDARQPASSCRTPSETRLNAFSGDVAGGSSRPWRSDIAVCEGSEESVVERRIHGGNRLVRGDVSQRPVWRSVAGQLERFNTNGCTYFEAVSVLILTAGGSSKTRSTEGPTFSLIDFRAASLAIPSHARGMRNVTRW